MLRGTREKLVKNHKTYCSISPVGYFLAVDPLMIMIIDWPEDNGRVGDMWMNTQSLKINL